MKNKSHDSPGDGLHRGGRYMGYYYKREDGRAIADTTSREDGGEDLVK